MDPTGYPCDPLGTCEECVGTHLESIQLNKWCIALMYLCVFFVVGHVYMRFYCLHGVARISLNGKNPRIGATIVPVLRPM